MIEVTACLFTCTWERFAINYNVIYNSTKHTSLLIGDFLCSFKKYSLEW